jgi:hypothetical protein
LWFRELVKLRRGLYATNSSKNFQEAHDFCITMGGRLPEPQSIDMDTVLVNFAHEEQLMPIKFWLGFNDFAVEAR